MAKNIFIEIKASTDGSSMDRMEKIQNGGSRLLSVSTELEEWVSNLSSLFEIVIMGYVGMIWNTKY